MGQSSWLSIEKVAAKAKITLHAVRRLIADPRLTGLKPGEEVCALASSLKRRARHTDSGAARSRLRRAPVFLGGITCLALAGFAALAASPPGNDEIVPRQIPYRGYLDQNGTPVTNTALQMSFDLFTTEEAGAAVWSETQTISVVDGQFSVALGDSVAIPAKWFAQPSLYLAIKVDGQPLTGRQRLLTVPYAHHARVASNADNASNAVNASYATHSGDAATSTEASHAQLAETAKSVSGGSVKATSGSFTQNVTVGGEINIGGLSHQFKQADCVDVLMVNGEYIGCPVGFFVVGLTGTRTPDGGVWAIKCCR